MKTAISMFMLLALPIAACASDPNKKAKEANVAEAETMREQREKGIEQQADQQVRRIEQQADQQKDQAGALPQSAEQRAKAQADIMAERQTFAARAQERLRKADARIEEARRKLQVAGGRAPLAAHEKLSMAERERSGVATDLGHVTMVSNERWSDETKRIESRLDALESIVDDVSSQADRVSK
jgi:hypothetical protein